MTDTSGRAPRGAGHPARRDNAAYYGGDLRRDLMDAALRVVQAEGSSAVTLRALARQLGVSHAAPANHFPDKTALFTALAVEGFELLGQAITDAAAAPRAPRWDGVAGGAAVGTLRAAGVAYMLFALAHRGHFEVMWRSDLLHAEDPRLVAAGGGPPSPSCRPGCAPPRPRLGGRR